MKTLGDQLRTYRLQRGWSCEELAERVGVSGQTVRSIETDPQYNAGLKLLKALGDQLNLRLVTFYEEVPMTMTEDRIRIGNDELIMHLRKHYTTKANNPALGAKIGKWLEENAGAIQLPHQYATEYMIGLPPTTKIPAVSATGLPKGAVIFEFDIAKLPELYRFLAELGGERKGKADYTPV